LRRPRKPSPVIRLLPRTEQSPTVFLSSALKEWQRLDATIREQFRKQLKERCENPRVPSAKPHGAKDRYKIKLRSEGYRLVYEVEDNRLVVLFIAVGKRERSAVYEAARRR
jgi:mRNA interferase RelE/StbE